MKIAFFVSILLFCLSCSSDYGNKVVGDNFTVYFVDVKDQKLAEKVAVYFKENELISNHKQDLQLVRVNGEIQLRLIASSPENIDGMPFEERKLLTALQFDLSAKVFNNESIDLVLCDENFEPIYTLD